MLPLRLLCLEGVQIPILLAALTGSHLWGLLLRTVRCMCCSSSWFTLASLLTSPRKVVAELHCTWRAAWDTLQQLSCWSPMVLIPALRRLVAARRSTWLPSEVRWSVLKCCFMLGC